MSGPYKCSKCKKVFKEDDRAVSMGERRFGKNPRAESTYPVIPKGLLEGRYYCFECAPEVLGEMIDDKRE